MIEIKNLIDLFIRPQEQELSEDLGEDRVTGLLSRTSFDIKIKELIGQATRLESRVGLILFEVDSFKEYGKASRADRDKCLKEVAGVVKECVRRRNEYLYRYDDEKFAVLVSGMNSVAFKKLANTIRLKVVRAQLKYISDEFITVSVGGVLFWPTSRDINSIERLLNDTALTCLLKSQKRSTNREVIEELGTMPKDYQEPVEYYEGDRRSQS